MDSRVEGWKAASPVRSPRVPSATGSAGRRLAATLALVAACGPVALSSRAAPPPRELQTTHRFGTGDGAPEAQFVLREIPALFAPKLAAGPESLDFADYTEAGALVLTADVLLGPTPTGFAVVPAGRHAVGLHGTSGEGPLRLVLSTPDGQRLALPLVASSRPAEAPAALSLEELPSPDPSRWTLALHLPRASGLLVVEAAGGQPSAQVAVPAPEPRRSRSQAIRDRYEQRSGAPERRRRRERVPEPQVTGPAAAP